MMSSILALAGEDRKPQQKWYFKDNGVTGINACLLYDWNVPVIILPYGLTDANRDLMLWAVETGISNGRYWGAQDAKRKVRESLGLM